MPVTKRKPKPRGKPFVAGGDDRRNPTKARDTVKTFSECFIAAMNKEVDALVDGQPTRAPRYELFIGQMIRAGIKGGTGTQARKLVLDFMNGLEVKETVADGKQAAEGEELFGADFPRQGPKSVRT